MPQQLVSVGDISFSQKKKKILIWTFMIFVLTALMFSSDESIRREYKTDEYIYIFIMLHNNLKKNQTVDAMLSL